MSIQQTIQSTDDIREAAKLTLFEITKWVRYYLVQRTPHVRVDDTTPRNEPSIIVEVESVERFNMHYELNLLGDNLSVVTSRPGINKLHTTNYLVAPSRYEEIGKAVSNELYETAIAWKKHNAEMSARVVETDTAQLTEGAFTVDAWTAEVERLQNWFGSKSITIEPDYHGTVKVCIRNVSLSKAQPLLKSLKAALSILQRKRS